MAVAAIDCGTNSLRLLVIGGGVELVRELRIVRLGQGIDQTSRLDPAAIERTRVALAEYRALIDAHRVTRLRMVATSATRDATNLADFQAMVRDTLGQEADVISGSQEAELSFAGAVADLPSGLDYVVVDIGGGSTEFVRGSSRVLQSASVDIGTVRIFERHLHSDPPTSTEIQVAVDDIAKAVRQSLDTVGSDQVQLVGVAGAVTTIAAVAMGPRQDDSPGIHHCLLAAEAIETVTESLCTMTHVQRSELSAIHPGRVDVIMGGALILREVMRQTGAPGLIVSEHDLLDGIAASI